MELLEKSRWGNYNLTIGRQRGEGELRDDAEDLANPKNCKCVIFSLAFDLVFPVH